MSDKDEKVYKTKIPVYTTKLCEESGGLFPVTCLSMIEHLKNKLKEFNDLDSSLIKDSKSRIKITHIDNIEITQQEIGEVSSVLVKFRSSDTNQNNLFVETNERVNLKDTDKIGSDDNYFFMYPVVVGLDSSKYSYRWLILLYQDPNKSPLDYISSVKYILRQVFGIVTKNIKLPTILHNISKMDVIPEMRINLYSLENNEDDVSSELKEYIINTKVYKKSSTLFSKIPIAKVYSSLSDVSSFLGLSKKEIKLSVGSIEYKITNEYKDDLEGFKQTTEQVFNPRFELKESELDKLYNEDYIVQIMGEVVSKYLSDYE